MKTTDAQDQGLHANEDGQHQTKMGLPQGCSYALADCAMEVPAS